MIVSLQDVGPRGLLVVPCVIGQVSQLFIDAYIVSVWATKEQERLAALANSVDIEMPNAAASSVTDSKEQNRVAKSPSSSAGSTSSNRGDHASDLRQVELGAGDYLDICPPKSHVRVLSDAVRCACNTWYHQSMCGALEGQQLTLQGLKPEQACALRWQGSHTLLDSALLPHPFDDCSADQVPDSPASCSEPHVQYTPFCSAPITSALAVCTSAAVCYHYLTTSALWLFARRTLSTTIIAEPFKLPLV